MRLHTLCIVAALSVSWASCGQAQEPSDGAEGQAQQDRAPAEALPLPFPVEIVEDEAETEARQRHAAEAREREIANLRAQQGMNEATQAMELYSLLSTIFVAIGTILVFASLLLMWGANRAAFSAVEITRRVGKAQLRAYVDVIRANFVLQDFKITPVITIRNFGQTPAHDLRIHFKSSVEKGFAANFPAEAHSGLCRHAGIGPGSEERFALRPDAPASIIGVIEHYLHVAGRVEYRTTFGEVYESSVFFYALVDTRMDVNIDDPMDEFDMAHVTEGLTKFHWIGGKPEGKIE